MRETTPSENEWVIMEVIWKANRSMTASEVIQALKGIKDVSQKTIRVMMNRLVSKGILDYTIDQNDARIYHYFAVKDREECLASKRERFIKNFFGGNTVLAIANFLTSSEISQEQLRELEAMVEQLKEEK
ncbi:MAG: BlaI/MecI/CopY family transcriptional regulator [Lachnospiraceae bacterium]|nr:BlaI/MecI/CopY family transcriptional regulator [Lachnospiraceae bacterium]